MNAPDLPLPHLVLDANRATWQELASLPSVGPAAAKRIVAERQKRGGLHSLKELDSVEGIGPRTLEQIAPYLRFNPPDPASTRPTALPY